MRSQSQRSQPQRKRGARRSGFTLVELMVVAIILGVLAALIVPQFLGRVGKARTAVAQSKIAVIESAIGLFATDYDRYPEDLDELVVRPDDVDEESWTPPALKAKDLQDPWGVQFLYRYPGDNSTFDLYTLGKDGTEGGDGENADVNNWE